MAAAPSRARRVRVWVAEEDGQAPRHHHWVGTYNLTGPSCYTQIVEGVQPHKLVLRGDEWYLTLEGMDHARQKDPEGPVTGEGRRGWKFVTRDGSFLPHWPMQVDEIEAEDDFASDSDDVPLPQLPSSRSRGAGTGQRRCRRSGPNVTLAGLASLGAEILRSIGVDTPMAEMQAGQDVRVRVRVTEGDAIGWEIESWLEVDRHKRKETSRSTRWKFVLPSGRETPTFHSSDARQDSVELHGGPNNGALDAEAFAQLGQIKNHIRAVLGRRRNDLQDAGKLLDEEHESAWQAWLKACEEGAGKEEKMRLKQLWAATAPAAAGAPEWQPAEWDAEPRPLRGHPRAFNHSNRKRRERGEGSGGGFGGLGGLPRTTSHPSRRQPRDEFLAYVTRALQEKAASAAAAAAGPGGEPGSESEGSEGEACASDAPPERKRQRPAPRADAAGEEEDQRMQDATEAAAPAEPAAPRREGPPTVSVRQLLSSSAAEDAFMRSADAAVWERLANGAASAAGDGGEEGFTAADCDVAWRYAIASATLGRIDPQFHNCIVDLLRESQRQGLPPGYILARLLVVKEALVSGPLGGLKDFAGIIRTLVMVGLHPPDLGVKQPGGSNRLESHELLDLVAASPQRIPKAAARALQESMAGDAEAPALCAFASSLCHGAGAFAETAAETVRGLLLTNSSWLCWRRGLAALLGMVLAGSEAAAEALLQFTREDAAWPTDAPHGEKWCLWLLLACSPSGELALASRRPQPAVEHAMLLWEEVLSPRHERQLAVRLVTVAAPLFSPKELVIMKQVDRLKNKADAERAESRLKGFFGIWAAEATLLCEEAENRKLDLSKSNERKRVYTYLVAFVMAAIASQRLKVGGPAEREAAACLSATLRLALAPGAGHDNAAYARDWVEENCCGKYNSKDSWPPLRSVHSEHFHAEGEGAPHFSTNGPFAELCGKKFADVYNKDKDKVKWMVAQHLKDWRQVGAPPLATEAASHPRNPEVNRFAEWLLVSVFPGDAPLLPLPRPRSGSPAGQVEEELWRASKRAALVCRDVFAPVLSFLLRQPRAAAPAATPARNAAGGSQAQREGARRIPSWLRAAALAAALRAGCLALADPDEGKSERTGYVAAASQEVLGYLAEGSAGEVGMGRSRPANEALAQVCRLEENLRNFALAGVARDYHSLLLCLQRLGHAGELRAGWLFKLVAVAARRLQGKWPSPPACPKPEVAFFVESLRYNPVRDAAPPGYPQDLAVSSKLLALRPLSALLAYTDPPPQGTPLGSLRLLEAAVSAWRPDARQPSPEEHETQFGAWAEALSGSDAEDFARLRAWRTRTFEALEGVVKAHLLAAVSSRCAAVHFTVAKRRSKLQGSPTPLQQLLALLLRDFGEHCGKEVLEAHRNLFQMVAQRRAATETEVWAARHLLYRYSAIHAVRSSLREMDGGEPLLAVTEAGRRLHHWVGTGVLHGGDASQRQKFLDETVAQMASLPAGELSSGTQAIAEEIAGLPTGPDGVFQIKGCALVRTASEVAQALLHASESSAFDGTRPGSGGV